jgi:ATPase subunit of ABC transporter with duplicated ATPase domains
MRWSSWVGRRAGRFSLGMGQRLGIATALLGDSATVILDEPVNGLDPEGIRWVRDLLRSLLGDLAAEAGRCSSPPTCRTSWPSEWTRFRTQPSTARSLLATVALIVGFGVL